MLFDEFRLVVQPDFTNPAAWGIYVENASRPMIKGPQPSLVPVVTPGHLAFLRNPQGGQDLPALQTLGSSVLSSIMSPKTLLGLEVCLQDAQAAGRGLRIVIAMKGNGGGAGQIDCHELPVEAIFSQQLHFPALDVSTPVSRGVTFAPDKAAVKVAPPLRILVVASEPQDMPPVNAAAELKALNTALQPLTAVGAVELTECQPPTLGQLATELQRRAYHIVHFIGHGDFEIVGADPNPQPHLYFEDGTANRSRRPADVTQIHTALRNGNVPLVVLTACSSAATQSNISTRYPGLAFEGLAQALVESVAGPIAAVGMQFDFETAAAETFSGALYQKLLNQGTTIDEAVASARAALVHRFGSGHRAWVNPTLYWRCIGGMVFDLLNTGGTLSPEQEAKLLKLDTLIQPYEEILRQLKQQPPAVQQALAATRADWQAKVQNLIEERGQVLGETVRLRGGQITANREVECPLTIQLRSGAVIGDVSATIEYDPVDFTFVQAAAVAGAQAAQVFTQTPASGRVVVLVQDASAKHALAAGEHALATIKFRVAPNTKAMLHIQLSNLSVQKNGAVDPGFRPLHAIVFDS